MQLILRRQIIRKNQSCLLIEYHLKAKRSETNIKLERYREYTPLFRDLCVFEAGLDSSMIAQVGEGLHLICLQTN